MNGLTTDMREWTFPITKAEMQGDGSLIVEGVATSEALDNTEPVPEIVDYDNAKACMEGWPGNVREMHQLKAVGRSLGWSSDDDARVITLRTRVSSGEPGTIAKVLDGTLNSYSVAGPPLKRVMESVKKADGSRVTANRLFYKRFSEISLVDRGMNPEARFSIVKADGPDDEVPEPVQVWACQDLAHRHVFKSEAAACIAEQCAAKVAAREDVKPAEGKEKYGDVAFADAKNKKYPIDTEAHIRAAWNYISKRKNAAKYSAADVKAIKAKIVAAWKKMIDKEGPPSAAKGEAMYDLKAVRDAFVQKAAAFGVMLTPPTDDVLKVGFAPDQYGWSGSKEVQDALSGLYALSLVEDLIRSEEFEEGEDADDERQVQVLTGQVVAGLVDFIGSELAELIEDEAAGDGEEAMKAIGVRAKAMITKENAQAVHDHVVKNCGAKCKAAKDDDGGGDGEKGMTAGTQPLHPAVTRIGPKLRAHLNKSNGQSAHDHAVSLGAKCMKAEKADEVPEPTVKAEPAPVVPEVTPEPVAVPPVPAVKTDAPAEGDSAKVQADLDAVKAEIASFRAELGALSGERDALKAELVAVKAAQIKEPGTPIALDAEGRPVPASFLSQKGEDVVLTAEETARLVEGANGSPEALKVAIGKATSMRLAENGVKAAVNAVLHGRR
jgi:hypothetical protein